MSNSVFQKARRLGVMLIVLFGLTPVASAPASAESAWYFTGFGGVLTKNRWHEVLLPTKLQLASSGLLGVGLGWERDIGASRFSFGFEAQAVAHFGRQDHFEFNLPLVVRYTPRRPSPRWVKNVSFGVGLSHATKIPQVEIDRKETSQRNYVYWLADIEFAGPQPDTKMFLRLHHRSDAFGLYEVPNGSTGIVVGWRKSF